MIAFKLDVGDAIRIVDQFNEVQNSFRVSAEDLSEGISTIGVTAQQSGIQLEQLTGYIASIAGATGMSGNEIGVA